MSLLREPLVHFVVIGVAVLGIDLARGSPEAEDDGSRIVITDTVRREVAAVVQRKVEAPPSKEVG